MTLTPCQREYQEISRSWAWRGPMVPQCANDGSYEPKQCDRTNCFCVNKHGVELEGTRISRLEAGKLSCRLTGKFVVVIVVVVGCFPRIVWMTSIRPECDMLIGALVRATVDKRLLSYKRGFFFFFFTFPCRTA